MFNVSTKVAGTVLTITIDVSKAGTRSASGKSDVIASTKGNVVLADGLRLGLNLYRPVETEAK